MQAGVVNISMLISTIAGPESWLTGTILSDTACDVFQVQLAGSFYLTFLQVFFPQIKYYHRNIHTDATYINIKESVKLNTI